MPKHRAFFQLLSSLPISYQKLIETVYSRYTFLNLNETSFYEIIVKPSLTIQSSKSRSKLHDLEQIIIYNIDNYLNKKLKEDAVPIINSYLNKYLKITNNSSICLKQLSDLSDFLIKYNCELTIDDYSTLINKNKKLQNNLSIITNKYIKNSTIPLESRGFSQTINDLVQVYGLINGTTQDEELGDKNELEGLTESNISDSIAMYLKEIRQYPLLTGEEERDLAIKASKGDRKARERLINSNLRLVTMVAKRYRNLGLSLQDLIQEGNLGLMKAIEKYDANKGFKLSTYAPWWIRQAITKAIYDKGPSIRFPVHLQERIQKCHASYNHLSSLAIEEPTISDIAKDTGFTEQQVKYYLSINLGVDSLNRSVGDEEDGNIELGAFIPSDIDTPEESYINSNLSEIIQKVISVCHFDERTIDILTRRYGLDGNSPQTLEQIGQKYHVTRERIRQMEKRALQKLRSPQCRKILDGYIEGYDVPKISESYLACQDSLSILPKEIKDDKQGPSQDLFALFSKCLIIIIKISKLKEQEIFKSPCGIDYDKIVTACINKEPILNSIIIPKISEIITHELLKGNHTSPNQFENVTTLSDSRCKQSEERMIKMRRKNLIELLPNYTKESILSAVDRLTAEEKQILIDYYGENLDTSQPLLTEDDRKRLARVHSRILPKLRKILEREASNNLHSKQSQEKQTNLTEISESATDSTNRTTNITNDNISQPPKDIEDTQNIAAIVSTFLLTNNDLSLSSIANFLHIPESEIRSSVIQILTGFKKQIDYLVDLSIENLSQEETSAHLTKKKTN